MNEFSFQSKINLNVKKVFDWHKNTFALERLTPPWDFVSVNKRQFINSYPLINGGKIEIKQKIFPLVNLKWKLIHQDYSENKKFTDLMLKGPFKFWRHEHIFQEKNLETNMIDKIQYKMHLSNDSLNSFIKNKLNKSFEYRHKILKRDLNDINLNEDENKYVLIIGGSGLVGSHLIPLLNSLNYKIIQLKFSSNVSENFISHDFHKLSWDPYKDHYPEISNEIANKIKFAINLSGENILGLATKSKKKLILESRTKSTYSLKNFLIKNKIKLECVIHASATGFYGGNSDIKNDEDSKKGKGFLSDTTEEWEYYQNKFSDIADRVINLRIGAVISRKGGFLKNVLLPYNLKLGIGINSNNHISYISIEDLCRSISYLMKNVNIKGVVNAVSPSPIKLIDIFKEINLIKKPIIKFNIPSNIIRKVSDDIAKELIFSNQYILPSKLMKSDFNFLHKTFIDSLRYEFGVEKK